MYSPMIDVEIARVMREHRVGLIRAIEASTRLTIEQSHRIHAVVGKFAEGHDAHSENVAGTTRRGSARIERGMLRRRIRARAREVTPSAKNATCTAEPSAANLAMGAAAPQHLVIRVGRKHQYRAGGHQFSRLKPP